MYLKTDMYIFTAPNKTGPILHKSVCCPLREKMRYFTYIHIYATVLTEVK